MPILNLYLRWAVLGGFHGYAFKLLRDTTAIEPVGVVCWMGVCSAMGCMGKCCIISSIILFCS